MILILSKMILILPWLIDNDSHSHLVFDNDSHSHYQWDRMILILNCGPL